PSGTYFLNVIVLLTKPNHTSIDETQAVEEIPPNMACKWPPSTREDTHYGRGHNITLCVRLDPSASQINTPTTYLLSDLFRGLKGRGAMSFEDLGMLPRRLLESGDISSGVSHLPTVSSTGENCQSCRSGSSCP
uniref:Integrin_alpha2 domain-containing protein n=1 Tax=Mesocestoides corti TaxID=53468 RepID=A0A5K3FWD8_MESCO